MNRQKAAMQTEQSPTIVAVVVTRNRLSLLKECIAALKAQSRPVDDIVVVDNDSSDGTADWLTTQPLRFFRQPNLGGAGGFHRGILEAYALKADWIWVMDDDSVAESSALQRLVESPAFSDPDLGFLSSLVLWTDGSVHKMNALPSATPATWANKVLAERMMPVKRATFVGMLISRRAVKAIGLPFRQFEIWGDDTEYSRRILCRFHGLQVLDSIVVHKTAQNLGSYVFPVPKQSYWKWLRGVRNDLYIARTNPIWREKLAFGSELVACVLKRVLIGHAPIKSLWWLAKGFIFNPPIDYPDPMPACDATRARIGAAEHT